MGNEKIDVDIGGGQDPPEEVMGSGEDMWDMEEVLEETTCSWVWITGGKALDG